MTRAGLQIAGLLLMAAYWAAGMGAEPAPEDFVRGWALGAPPGNAAYRVRLDSRVMETLADSEGLDLVILDAEGRPVPWARLSARQLTETRHWREPLEFRGERLESGAEPASEGTELMLDLGESGTRLTFRTPGGGDSAGRAGDHPGYRALVATAPDSGPEWQWTLVLEFHSDSDRVAGLDCRLNPADTDRPAETRLRLDPLGDSRPYRFRAAIPLGWPLPGGWQILCFGEAPPGFELHAARQQGVRRVMHEQRQTLKPVPVPVPGAPGAYRLDLGGPYRITGLTVNVDRPNLVSRAIWFSSDSPAGSRVSRGTTVVSTLPGTVDSVNRIRPDRNIRHRYWYLETDPPVTSDVSVTVETAAEEVLFLAQGKPPWMLAAGSARVGAEDANFSWFGPALERLGPAWELPVIDAGSPLELGGESALRPAPEPLPWQRYVLWTVLIAGVVAVAWLAFRLLRAPD